MTCDVNQLYKDVVGDCPTAPKVEIVQLAGVDCSVITCVTKTTTYATVAGKCVATWAYTHPTVPIPASPVEVAAAIAPVQLVKNFTANGEDCAGLPVSVAGVQGQLIQTVPHPTAVQMVKICPPSPKVFDREMVVMCAPDGTKVAIQNVTAEDAPLGTAPTFEAWTLNGAPYVGSITALTDCGTEKVDISTGEDYCAAGVNYTRVDFIDTTTLLPIGSIWLDDNGTPVGQPAGAAKGLCAIQAFDLIYLERNGGVVKMADIVAATGATKITSVTVKQISGRGTITGDTGSGVPLDTEESWSWGNNNSLINAQLVMDASGGEQRITAIYTI
jgi:hypothetical protein